MLRLDMNFTREFVDLYNKFNNNPKGRELLELNGISRNKLDIATISKDYFKVGSENMSVDPNANVGNSKNFNSYISEITKGLLKLDGYYLIWKYLNKLYNLEIANDMISKCIIGKYYFHDITKCDIPYCVALSTSSIATMGRPYGNLQSSQPKRSSSFIAQCIENLMTSSQNFAGATSLSDVIILYSWYIHKEYEGLLENNVEFKYRQSNFNNDIEKHIEKKIENDFQSFVHISNNNFRIGGDSPFSNISLYCRSTIKNMFEDYHYPDGSSPLDIIETIMKVQKIFMKFIAKKDPLTGIPYRFPVTTCNIYVDKENKEIEDKEFLNDLAECNTEGVFNLFITSSDNKARIASCCFSGKEYIFVQDKKQRDNEKNNKSDLTSSYCYTIKEFVEKFLDNETGQKQISEWYIKDMNENYQEITGVLCKENEYDEMIEITINNNKIRVTPDHMFNVYDLYNNEEVDGDLSAFTIIQSPDRYLINVYDMNDDGSYEIKLKKIEHIKRIKNCKNIKVYDIELVDNHYFSANNIFSHNCRMINNKTDLMNYRGIDSFGNGGLNLGSHRVVSINLPHLARTSKDIEEFKIKLKESMEDCIKLLTAHRTLIKDRIEQNFLQFFKPLHWLDLDTMFFSTIGFIGIYECFKYLGYDLLDNQDVVIDIFKYCNEFMNELASKHQIPINLEQIPGENAAINLAKKDKVYFGENEYNMYSNQFIPLNMDIDLITRAQIDGKLSRYFGGGVITHLNINSTTSKEQMIKLIEFASSKCGLDHFALNCCFNECEDSHVNTTNQHQCPKCGKQIVNHYTRVVGYLTNVNDWSKTRQEEDFPFRKFGTLNLGNNSN